MISFEQYTELYTDPATPAATFESDRQLQLNYDWSYIYYYVAGAGIIGVLILRHIAQLLLRIGTRGKPIPPSIGFLEALSSKWLTSPAFFGWNWIEVFAITFLLAFNFAELWTGTMPQHLSFKESFSADRLRWVSRRAGLISIQNMPLAFALSSRNNILSYLTGIRYEKLRMLHKCVGIIVFVTAVAHGILYTAAELKYVGSNRYSAFLQVDTVRQAIMGICGASILFGSGLYWMRKYFYELFLALHIVGAAVFIAGVWLHRPPRRNWVDSCMVIWGLDRLIRVARVFYAHFLCPLTKHGKLPIVRANAKVVAGAIVLTIPISHQWGSGHHVYLTFCAVELLKKPWLILQSHPWSVANIPVFSHQSQSLSVQDQEKANSEREVSTPEMLLIIRVRNGITKSLKQLIEYRDLNFPNSGTELPVFLDGPYGRNLHFDKYDSIVLFAGGSGVTHTLSVFLDGLHRIRTKQSGQLKNLYFIWAIQQEDHLSWISSYLNLALEEKIPKDVRVEIRIFVTRGVLVRKPSTSSFQATPFSSSSKGKGSTLGTTVVATSTAADNLTFDAKQYITIESGRPDVKHILEGVVDSADGAVLTLSCGPKTMEMEMSKTARSLTSPKAVLNGRRNKNIHVEVANFGW